MAQTNAKPRYSTLVRALADIVRYVDGHVLGPMSRKEVLDTYRELDEASSKARKLVKRARAATIHKNK